MVSIQKIIHKKLQLPEQNCITEKKTYVNKECNFLNT